MVDDCMVEWQRLGFAWACTRIKLTQLLRHGMLVKEPKGPFWQWFVYERLEKVFYRCGHLHSLEVACPIGVVVS